jgi:F-type H+-transporting ATPase subunit b
METLQQLGELLLGAIPTVVLFTITFLAYRFIVHGKLEEVLHERRARTQGAVEKARADIAAAEAKTAQYEDQLRAARTEIFKQAEARRRQWAEERSTMAQQARSEADAKVAAARTAIEREMETAKAELKSQADALAAQVVQAVLKRTPQTVGAER